jgi:hypothetical protein
MATERAEIVLGGTPDEVWDAVRDFAAVRHRLCPGVLVDSRPDGDGRVVTFANGAVVREVLVAVDDAERRLVYAVTGGSVPFTHHQASMQVVPAEGGACLVWTSDLLPDDLAPRVAALMQQGAAAMRTVFPLGTTSGARGTSVR